MDSYRETTILGSDTEDDSSDQSNSPSYSSDESSVSPTHRKIVRNRLLSSDEDETPKDDNETSKELSQVENEEQDASEIANNKSPLGDSRNNESNGSNKKLGNKTKDQVSDITSEDGTINVIPHNSSTPNGRLKNNMQSSYTDEDKSHAEDDFETTHNFIKNTKFNSTAFNETEVAENTIDEIESKVASGKSDIIEASTNANKSETIILSATNSINNSGSSVEFVPTNEETQIIASDSEDEAPAKPKLTQLTLRDLIRNTPKKSPPKRQITRLEYVQMRDHLESLNLELRRFEAAVATAIKGNLPDKGASLKRKKQELLDLIKAQQDKFEQVEVKNETVEPIKWNAIEDGATAVQPRTFGKQAMQTYTTEKALTLERLSNLHSSLKTCPTPETLADDPSGLKVDLMVHQKHALAWLMWREQQKPRGGILADDMGLGKTLTIISLVLAWKQLMAENDDQESSEDENEEEEESNLKYKGGTLIVCPASLLGQWVNEVHDKLESGLLNVETYHGPKRETKAKRLSRYDIVVTTYSICATEIEMQTALYRIKWDRIVLDEGHQIRNHKSKTAQAICRLGGTRRWVLTGTPVHNKELDIYALLKFLRCSPFDDLAVFKRWASEKSAGGAQRLHTVLSSMLLRRTKEQLKELNQLKCLPERNWSLIEVTMDEDETAVYQKILLFSKTLFAQFLHQRAEKNTDMAYDRGLIKINDPNNEYYKMHKKLLRMNKLPEVKSSDILVLFLRLRQMCCHPSLILAMLENVADLGAEEEFTDSDMGMNILDQLNKLNINDDNDENPLDGINSEGVALAEASTKLLNQSNPVFAVNRKSAKLSALFKLLQDIIPTGDKVIVVSQWTTFLNLMIPFLKELNIEFCELNGTIPVIKRGAIVNAFNNPKNNVQIMLLSLTAGGVGLNLVGANHLIFVDLHWNPQLEMQAQDRIYRVGQRKTVNIYKLMTVDAIEERIKNLQERKKQLAESVLNNTKMKQNAKLTMDDLKMLFNM